MSSGTNKRKKASERRKAGKRRAKRKEGEDCVVESEEPSALWRFIVDHADIFEAEVLRSGKLNGSDLKMFYGLYRASRGAVERAKIELREEFYVHELSSISTLELAWEGFAWGARIRLPNGVGFTMDQEYFSFRVAVTNELELLRWVREEKECDWDWMTSGAASLNGNLEMLKYCCENGCEVDARTSATAAKNGNLACLEYLRSKNIPWDERVCEYAHENNHIDVLTYAVKNKCPGFEAYEQFVPK